MKSYDQLCEDMQQMVSWHVPEFEIKDKESSFLMKLIDKSVMWIFNKEFMTRYTTTVGYSIYVPKGKSNQSLWRTIAHEWWHMHSMKKLGAFLHGFLYLFPQTLSPLALLAILGFWFPWAVWFLTALVFLLPLPAYFRYREELDAYTVSMAAYLWRYKSIPDDYIDHVAKNFYKSNYYFMWPFKDSVINKLKERRSLLIGGAFDAQPIFGDVKSVIKEG